MRLTLQEYIEHAFTPERAKRLRLEAARETRRINKMFRKTKFIKGKLRIKLPETKRAPVA